MLFGLINDNNDKERFRFIYKNYIGLAAFVVRKRISKKEDVEDTLQEIFLYIAENLDKIDELNLKKTKAYIATVSQGFAIKKYKKESKYVLLNEFETDSLDYERYFDSFDSFELKELIDSLDDEQKNLIYLTYVFGYSGREISEMLGISEANVRKKLQFARREIKDKLEGRR